MSNDATLQGMSGRAASQARRKALSQGKSGLPAASERIRSGFREAAMPGEGTVQANTVSDSAGQQVAAKAVETSSPAVQAAPSTSAIAASGRDASIARRKALSAGKGGLPQAKERIRSGFREAAMPNDTQDAAALQVTAEAAPAAPVVTPAPAAGSASFVSGREAAVARRKSLSAGKGGLPPAQERVRSGFREAAMPKDAPQPASQTEPQAAAPVEPAPSPAPATGATGREAAMKHRQMRSQVGRGDAPNATPCGRARQGQIKAPPKVPVITTAVSNANVTGLSYATGRAMTGAEAGHDKPLTGTQYVGGQEGAYRASLGKVGQARTDGGQTVSGTMVRSTVRITGDEDSDAVKITGNADQTLKDDVNPQGEAFVATGAQFQRQSDPHGQSVHGSNLGRSVKSAGSRSRDTERPVEESDKGHAISGTAIGRSIRVTGDETGATRSLTGSQYLAPAAAQLAQAEGGDPATGSKVTLSETWGGQKISGPQMEHDDRVTGSEHGSCAPMTGTPYYGATGGYGWCDPAQAEAEEAYRAERLPQGVTGDVPLNDPGVSGTDRGAERAITGSRYFVQAEAEAQASEDAVASSLNSFSVSSPQRAAQLQTRANEAQSSAITGTFAQGEGKITGNVEFSATLRSGQTGAAPARGQITGEGSVKGATITGSAWSENSRVTGTEDLTATSRNPSERSGSSHGFAGAARFKSQAQAPSQARKSAVTGAVGWSAGTGAAVTLSGGAAG